MRFTNILRCLAAAAALAGSPGWGLTGAAAPTRDLHDYWHTRCKECHGDSAEFARSTLGVEGGRLTGVQHRTDMAVFLRNHYLADELLEPVSAMLVAQVTTPPDFKAKCGSCHATAAEFARKSLALRAGVLVGLPSGMPVADKLRGHGGLSADEAATMVNTLKRVLAEVGGAPKP